MKNLEALVNFHFIENIKHTVSNGLWGKTLLMCTVELLSYCWDIHRILME